MHGLEHWTHFYTDYGVDLQKRFFAHYLKGEDNGWQDEPPVRLQIRHLDRFEERSATSWPLPDTNWTTLFLDGKGVELVADRPGGPQTVDCDPAGPGVTFMYPAFETETEITGPSALKLFISSETEDADIFAVLRVIDENGDEVTFQGAIDSHTPIGQGWLRASHRRLDPDLSRPIGRITPMTARSHSSPARCTSSTSRYGRLLS